jgi:polyphosphate glucokinase
MSNETHVLGVDIGGTGVKTAVVDLATGRMSTERQRLPTPHPATPSAIIGAIKELKERLNWHGPVGCGFPGLVKGGTVKRAPNLDSSWIGLDLVTQLTNELAAPHVAIGNDADAAGLAEFRFGAGKNVNGTVVVITLGTGIGSAIFHDGVLLPDTEMGHIELDGKQAEKRAAESVREDKGLSWKKWARRVNAYLAHLEYLLGVDLFILGGGVSKKPEKFFPYLTDVTCKVEVARLGNAAGIIGAAMFTAEK